MRRLTNLFLDSECIDLANGRAPPTFENVDTTFVTQPLESSTLSRQRLQDHLDELQDISDLLERGEDPRDRSELLNEERKPNWRRRLRGRDGINAGFKTHWDSITQQTAEQERNDHHQNRDSARGDSPRRLQKPSRRPKVDMTGVDTAAILKGPEVDQDTSGKREERKRHRNRAPVRFTCSQTLFTSPLMTTFHPSRIPKSYFACSKNSKVVSLFTTSVLKWRTNLLVFS